jgi:CubicO group peptidase (beta-lactamase class C family)
VRAARVALIVMVGCLAVAHAEDATDEALGKKIDAIVTSQVQRDGAGAAVALIVSGKVVHRKGYGLASIESKTPIGTGTQFDLASCTKNFTATALELLAERGALSFEDEARKYLPELPAPRDKKRPLRVIDLLHHTSGLVEYTGHVEKIKTTKQVLELAAARRSRKAPGSEFEYCNTNYALLGLIVERVTQKSLREVFKKEIFEPLEMKDTDLLDATRPPLEARATGYKRRHAGKPPRRTWVESSFDTPGITGDGGVFTTLDDMIKWDAALARAKLVKPATLALAFASG